MGERAVPVQSGVTRQSGMLYGHIFFGGISATLMGALMPLLLEEFSLDYTVAGGVVTASYAGALASTMLAGIIPRRLGNRRTLVGLMLCMPAGYLALVFGGTAPLLMAAFALIGASRSGGSALGGLVVADISRDTTAALNLFNAVYAVGAALGPLLVSLCTLFSLGWRPAVWLQILMAALLLPFFAATRFSEVGAASGGAAEQKPSVGRAFLRRPRFWHTTLILLCYGCTEYALVGWMVTYLADLGTISVSYAQSLSSILWGAILVGRLLCAWVAGRMARPSLLLVLVLGVAGGYLGMLLCAGAVGITVSVVVLGLFMSGIYPTCVANIADLALENPLALTTMLTIMSVGGMLIPGVIGLVADLAGMFGGMLVVAATVGLLVVFGVVHFVARGREEAETQG